MTERAHYAAERYALRGLHGTDSLAFEAVAGAGNFDGLHILDLGCGAGRSSRFLSRLGARVTGLDCNPDMMAQWDHPGIEQVLVRRGEAFPFDDGRFDGFFSSWVLPEMDAAEAIVALLRECARVTQPGGAGWVIVNTPEFYRHHWLSCDTGSPENSGVLRSGQAVRVRLLPEGTGITDTYWSDADYRGFFDRAGLSLTDTLRPTASGDDPAAWKDETRVAPYAVYRLCVP